MAVTNIDLSGGVRFRPKYISANWRPKEDITPWEIALCLPAFGKQSMTEAEWDGLGSAQRHWERID
jgi:hypothetical protein